MIALLALFAFILTWQFFNYAFIFLIFIFYAFMREFLIFLKFRKNVLKEATIVKNSLIYRITSGDFYLYIISFFMALFATFSLFSNLITSQKQDFLFLFIFLPLFLLFFKKKFHLQFIDNAYNDFRIIVITSFFTAFIYSLFNLFFVKQVDFNLNDFYQNMIYYKNSSFFIFDFISQCLAILNGLKEYFLFSFGIIWFKIFNFIFDFLNFFILSSFISYLYNFAFKKNKIYIFIFSFLIAITLFFSRETKNESVKTYHKEIFFMVNNLSFLKEQNLSTLKEDKDKLDKNLRQVREILNKNAFEIGIWWFSKEKEDLQKSLNESLK
ncbi:hypothetical protein [Campylobacter estrildidarum]|uniref:Uncharacterized protein n=1 Tax=Campylobacter estrildidarum TaxID=2510189 RepID=A0A4U7BJQ1_9BACT|nr:hypothetical protein [Campylobacter estrildidarum]TKX31819.1 hypothetical protein CQA69_01980 [Campylobacter estrildidarum]